MYYCRPLHTDEQGLDDQQELIYCSSVLIQGVARKNSQERWTIEMSVERVSGKSMLATRQDDDDDYQTLQLWNCNQK